MPLRAISIGGTQVNPVLAFIALAFAVVAVAAFVELGKLHGPVPDWEGSGHEFLVQHHGVDATLSFDRNVRRTDALMVDLKLTPATIANSSNVADESDGTLTPVLTVPDCTATPLTMPLSKPTTQPIYAFEWVWSIRDCAGAGTKQFGLQLNYDGHAIDTDPVAYRNVGTVNVSDSITLDDWLKIAAAASALLAPILGFLAVVVKGKVAA